jgi:hypothetical protein
MRCGISAYPMLIRCSLPDVLLPKLPSGEIRVKGPDKFAEKTA